MNILEELVLSLFVMLASAALVWISFFIGLSVGTEAAAAFPMFLLFVFLTLGKYNRLTEKS